MANDFIANQNQSDVLPGSALVILHPTRSAAGGPRNQHWPVAVASDRDMKNALGIAARQSRDWFSQYLFGGFRAPSPLCGSTTSAQIYIWAALRATDEVTLI